MYFLHARKLPFLLPFSKSKVDYNQVYSDLYPVRTMAFPSPTPSPAPTTPSTSYLHRSHSSPSLRARTPEPILQSTPIRKASLKSPITPEDQRITNDLPTPPVPEKAHRQRQYCFAASVYDDDCCLAYGRFWDKRVSNPTRKAIPKSNGRDRGRANLPMTIMEDSFF